MPLSWNEIRDRALQFSREWADESSEDAEAKSFWDAFFTVFGVTRRRLASFEEPVKKSDGAGGYIDLLWKGILLVEHKSRGKNLDRAFKQATDYFPGLKERDLPRYVLVSDFARLRLYDLDSSDDPVEFPIKDLHRHVRRFGFIAGYQVRAFKDEDPANIRAAERMGKLHDGLKEAGYSGHALEVLLVRLLFCLFAEDTGIFERRPFQDFLEQRTAEDGSDVGAQLNALFQVMNTPEPTRGNTLEAQLAAFPFVNGKLFAETLPVAFFNRKLRDSLLDAAGMDWSPISPAIFGALFQSIMDAKARRNLGAHYTSEKNILKLIHPLFLDELWAEYERIRSNRNKLHDFHERLARLTFLDPACGCGNFLVVAYRALRELELQVILATYEKEIATGQTMDPRLLIKCNVDQFHGIEIEDFPAQIAQVAMWLTDHQMNLRVQEAFGNRFVRLPLEKSAAIAHANALRMDWNDVLPADRASYVLGNPPFVGAKLMTGEQREDLLGTAPGLKGAGLLDFVSAWYLKAAAYVGDRPVRCAFVSTNSITQGEQVGILWGALLAKGFRIPFAHRTFQWNNEARGMAAVHCVIVGFGREVPTQRRLFEYDNPRSEPHEIAAANINPYLVDAADVLLSSRSTPLCDVPAIGIGNKPIDGGNYLFTRAAMEAFVAEEPAAEAWFRRWLGADEFLNGTERWCLALRDCPPSELRRMPACMARVQAVKQFRLASNSPPTQALASTPTHFHVECFPIAPYLIIPRHSSENRSFIPMGFIEPDALSGDANLVCVGAGMYHFGVMQSTMHMAWVRAVCGRLKSDFRYSAGIVYNNFPWPDPTDAQRAAIAGAAQGVLDARAGFAGASLADLYDPVAMPAELVKAHHALDRAVDAAYGRRVFRTDAERVAFLFDRFAQLSSLLPRPVKPARRKASGASA